MMVTFLLRITISWCLGDALLTMLFSSTITDDVSFVLPTVIGPGVVSDLVKGRGVERQAVWGQQLKPEG